MKVDQIMTRNVACFTPETSLAEISARMWSRDCGCTPIVGEGKRVVGMVTDRDICMGTTTKNLPPAKIRAKEVMSKRVFSCCPEDSVSHALDVMREHQVRRLPVVDEHGVLSGILSLNDVALAVGGGLGSDPSSDDVATTLRAICEHQCEIASVAPA